MESQADFAIPVWFPFLTCRVSSFRNKLPVSKCHIRPLPHKCPARGFVCKAEGGIDDERARQKTLRARGVGLDTTAAVCPGFDYGNGEGSKRWRASRCHGRSVERRP